MIWNSLEHWNGFPSFHAYTRLPYARTHAHTRISGKWKECSTVPTLPSWQAEPAPDAKEGSSDA